MGQLQSKPECFYLSPDLDKAIDDKLWKQKTGFNLANFNMDESLSELSICLEERTESSPLRVDLPPRRSETETSKLLTLDHVDARNRDRTKINIEEFECGVQFECSENAKQEWAVTLYDFDGHGRITKEDLASLLKALYDAVGSSIKLPPNGAKTLKLRLTVGQENVSHLQNPNIKSAERTKNTNRTAKHKVREFSKVNNLTRAQVKRTNEHLAQGAVNHEPASALNPAEMKNVNSQAGTTSHMSGPDHQHLAYLVQENLARSQGRQLRKHQNDSRNDVQDRHKRQHRAAALHCPTTSAYTALTTTTTNVDVGGTSSKFTETTTNNAAKESQDRRNYYLDLAGVENNSSKILNNVFPPIVGSSFLRSGNGKTRSRSRDVTSGVTNDVVPSSDKCDISAQPPVEGREIPSRLPQEHCDISSRLLHDKCDISARLQQNKCDISSRLTQEKCDSSGRLQQTKCDISSRLPQEKCEISSRLTQSKCDISPRLTQEKCEISSRLTQVKCDISSRLPQEKCEISSLLPLEKYDLSLRPPQEKCEISARLQQKKYEISSRLTQDKCDISSRLLLEKNDISSRLQPEKNDISSRLKPEKNDISSRLQPEKNDISSRQLPGKWDISRRLLPEKSDNAVKKENERPVSKQCQGVSNNQHFRSKSFDVQEMPQSSRSPKSKKPNGWLNFSGGRFRPSSLPGQPTLTVLPDYHRRHRHRDKDRDVMMQQVAEWIEREHVDSVEAGRVVIQRHEHHHIHEHHHHHHFHHHNDT